MSRKPSVDSETKKGIDVRTYGPRIPTGMSRSAPPTYSRHLHPLQAFRDTAAAAAEEVVYKTFPQKVRMQLSSGSTFFPDLRARQVL